MRAEIFEQCLDAICNILRQEALIKPFPSQDNFENRVRELCQEIIAPKIVEKITFEITPQIFPDIPIGEYGVEVKFTEKDTWRSIANSIQEKNRQQDVKHIYVIFGKMGGIPDIKWDKYENCVIHVRTSHVPRFEIEMESNRKSIFNTFGITYEEFSNLDIHEKMVYIRKYARDRLKKGERLWWLGDTQNTDEHSLSLSVRLYTSLDSDEKIKMRAEAALVSPSIVSSGRAKHKYDDAVLYLITYHGILCHQARDLFSAGSVANKNNSDRGGLYIAKSLIAIENQIKEASLYMDDMIFEEYWGVKIQPKDRLRYWLKLADNIATDWTPSKILFNGIYR